MLASSPSPSRCLLRRIAAALVLLLTAAGAHAEGARTCVAASTESLRWDSSVDADFVTIANDGGIAFWMSLQANSADSSTLRIRVDGGNELSLTWRNATNIHELNYDVGGNAGQCNVAAVEDSSWHHWAVVWNEVEDYIKFFLDGVQQCTKTYDGTFTGTPVAPSFFCSAGGLNVTFAHVQIFQNSSDSGRVAEEVNRLMRCVNTGLRLPQAHHFWHPLWESGNGNPIGLIGPDGVAVNTPEAVENGPTLPRWCGPSP